MMGMVRVPISCPRCCGSSEGIHQTQFVNASLFTACNDAASAAVVRLRGGGIQLGIRTGNGMGEGILSSRRSLCGLRAGHSKIGSYEGDAGLRDGQSDAGVQCEEQPAISSALHEGSSQVVRPEMSVSTPQNGGTTSLPENPPQATGEIEGPPLVVWIGLTFVYILLYTCAFTVFPILAPLEPLRVPLQYIYYAVVLIHVLEGSYAWYLARRIDPSNATRWSLQASYVGYFSLRLLLRRVKHNNSDDTRKD